MAAAFVGPGTIATCGQAGAQFGFSLLWILVFAVASCIVLQEQSARIGCVSRAGLGDALLGLRPTWARDGLRALACLSLGVANAALQAGNVAGGGLGLALLLDVADKTHECALLVGVVSLLLLSAGRTGALTHVLGGVVLGMSLLFLACAALAHPAPHALLLGLLSPSLPPGSHRTALALVGTTLCTYNLFLQSSAVAEAAAGKPRSVASLRRQLRWVRLDTAASALIGGGVSASLLVVSATAGGAAGGAAGETAEGAEGVGEMARGIARMLGPAAGQAFALGLCAAGLSSAITAPLAARLAVGELLPAHPAAGTLAWVTVAVAGTVIAAAPGTQPVGVILFAQCLNALLLPLLGGALVLMASQPRLLGPFRNGRVAMVAGWTVIALTSALGVLSLS